MQTCKIYVEKNKRMVKGRFEYPNVYKLETFLLQLFDIIAENSISHLSAHASGFIFE